MSLVLYGDRAWVSPYVFSCYLALREKGLSFELRELDLAAGESRDPAYLARTVTGRVPTLTHDSFSIGESQAIVEYLEDTFPDPRVLPPDPRERARCRQLMSWLRSDETLALRRERPTTTMFHERASTPLGPDAAASARKLIEVTQRILSPGAEHLFGSFCLADADLAFMLHRLILNGDDVPGPVRDWAALIWRRASVRAFVERERPQDP